MSTSISRRAWFKSALTAGAAMPLGLSLVQELMAAPASRAEVEFLSSLNGKLVRLGSNENPYGPSSKAREAIQRSIGEGNRYAFDQSQELKEIIAAHEGVTPDHIFMAAGSGEVLAITGMTVGLEGGSVLSAYPTFTMLMNFAQKFKARWDKIDLDKNMAHDLEAMAAAVKPDTRIVFVVNPNNPTGTVVDHSRLKNFCIEMAKKTTVFADEAYLEFLEPAQQQSMVELVKQGHNVIVSRTFSKIYGLAGLRIGYAVAKPDLIKKLEDKQLGTILNQAALAAAKASLGDQEFMSYTRKLNAEARAYFTDYLDRKKWFYGKSFTNVVLFPAPKSGKMILEETMKRGYQIRVWDYQAKEWCRVSIGTLDEMKSFVKVFDEIVS
ncbi:MAG: histidinol-phosphate aminotransferase family protein [Cyclobacteriaceae bacterium]|nr:histidinol-phosphate aminotransferase family protein [Cyclobacteriaceae bacterium]